MTVQSIAGRLRVRHHALRTQGLASSLAEKIRKLPGVQDLDINPRTSSLLVCYDAQALRPEDLLASLDDKLPGVLGAVRPAGPQSSAGSRTLQLSREERRKLAYAMLTSLTTSLAALLIHSKKAHVIAGGLFLAGLGLHLNDKKKFLLP